MFRTQQPLVQSADFGNSVRRVPGQVQSVHLDVDCVGSGSCAEPSARSRLRISDGIRNLMRGATCERLIPKAAVDEVIAVLAREECGDHVLIGGDFDILGGRARIGQATVTCFRA